MPQRGSFAPAASRDHAKGATAKKLFSKRLTLALLRGPQIHCASTGALLPNMKPSAVSSKFLLHFLLLVAFCLWEEGRAGCILRHPTDASMIQQLSVESLNPRGLHFLDMARTLASNLSAWQEVIMALPALYPWLRSPTFPASCPLRHLQQKFGPSGTKMPICRLQTHSF